jgi:hypothetical protein
LALFILQTPNQIGQINPGSDRAWSALTGRHERHPLIVKVLGQEFPAAFQERDREQERASRNNGAYALRLILV